MEPQGSALLKKEFTHTKLWPNPQITMSGVIDLEKEYKEALAGKMVTVMEVGVMEAISYSGEARELVTLSG